VKNADVVVLVTEPTPFGLNDLKLAVDMVRVLGLPFGVAVNRAGVGDTSVHAYCAQEKIPIVLEIPNDRAIAIAYSRGELAVNALPQLRPVFLSLYERLLSLASMPCDCVAVGDRSVVDVPVEPVPSPSDTVKLGKRTNVAELVVVSGKGGTGKTSIVASLASLAAQVAIADCDVDAADLHLVLGPSLRHQWAFSAGKTAVIDDKRCHGCGLCAASCRFGAIHVRNGTYQIDAISCEGCGVCVDLCPDKAIALFSEVNGQWFVSDTRHGPMTHARLGIAQENSGKLVSLVRRESKAIAVSEGLGRLICDGSPGIGCSVIASVAGARLVLVVTEPTLSALHDMKRVVELTRQFRTRTAICINKADINLALTDQIEKEAENLGVPVLGRIRYDEAVIAAQVNEMSVVEFGDGVAATDIRALWSRVKNELES